MSFDVEANGAACNSPLAKIGLSKRPIASTAAWPGCALPRARELPHSLLQTKQVLNAGLWEPKVLERIVPTDGVRTQVEGRGLSTEDPARWLGGRPNRFVGTGACSMRRPAMRRYPSGGASTPYVSYNPPTRGQAPCLQSRTTTINAPNGTVPRRRRKPPNCRSARNRPHFAKPAQWTRRQRPTTRAKNRRSSRAGDDAASRVRRCGSCERWPDGLCRPAAPRFAIGRGAAAGPTPWLGRCGCRDMAARAG